MTAWLRRLVTRRDRSAGLADEVRTHIAERTDDLVERGVPAAEARRQAHLEFGSVTRAVEDGRAVWQWAWTRRLQELRYAFRALTKQPGLSTAVVISLALGVGANTAIFSVINSLILKPLPVDRPDRLVQITPGGEFGSWSYPLWEQLRDRQDVLDGVGAWATRNAAFDLSTGGLSDRVSGLWVSASFFEVLGVRPALGRIFTAADDRRGGGPDGPVAVISHSFWQRRFGGDPRAIGSTLTLDGIPFSIVGVTRAGFLGPDVGAAFDVAVPFGTLPVVLRRDRLTERYSWWISVIGRLGPGQTAAAAAAGLARLQPLLRDLTRPPALRPEEAAAYLGTPITVTPAPGGPSALRTTYRSALAALMGIVALILLIACVNVANLLLARAERRQREVALQLALGASRASLVWQSFVESILLAVAGALAGVTMAMWGVRWLVSQIPAAGGAPSLDLSVDWRVLGFTVGLTMIVALLFGSMPALAATRVHATQALRERRPTTAAGRGRIGGALVVVQVALCVVLVVGAALFVRTFASLTRQDTGVDRDRVIVATVDARRSAKRGGPQIYSRLAAAVRPLPGVTGVAFSSNTPVSNNENDTILENLPGAALPESERRVYKNEVSPEWFATYGIPVVSGRDFASADQVAVPAVAVVNEAFARRYFGGRNPVGQTIRESGRPDDVTPTLTIVGLVQDAVYLSLREAPPPTLYLPTLYGAAVSVRVEHRAPVDLDTQIASAMATVDRDLSLTIRPLASDFAGSVARERLLALLSAFFGALALLLSAIGLYGVVSHGVGLRRTEIGIRMALGASRLQVVALVVRRVALLVGLGVIVGVPFIMWGAHSVSALLFGLQAFDPVTYLAAVALLAAVGAAAAGIPARRAAGIDPAVTLRAE